MAESKSPYRQAIDALGRAQKKVSDMRERGEQLAGEGMRTVICGVSSFGAGLLDQRYGAADAETGIRVHKVNGAPTSLLAAGAVKGAAALGIFGKFDTVGYAAGDGAFGHAASTWGRIAGERLRSKAEKTEKTEDKAEVKAAEAKAA
jgi:hypothetical protein